MDRPALKGQRARFVFVAESPHTSEIEPDERSERRPLCGSAGRKWWSALGGILEKDPSEDVSLERMLMLCRKHGVVVLNAVQYPLDQAITRVEPAADPRETVGFSKNAGPTSYKKLKKESCVQAALVELRRRLNDPAIEGARIYPLGNDSLWFVEQALGKEEAQKRLGERVYHPSAWWRKGGYFGKVSKERLEEILKA